MFAYRLAWGLFAVLAKLGARGQWRQPLSDLLYEAGEDRPRPYSDSELSVLAGLHT